MFITLSEDLLEFFIGVEPLLDKAPGPAVKGFGVRGLGDRFQCLLAVTISRIALPVCLDSMGQGNGNQYQAQQGGNELPVVAEVASKLVRFG